MKNCSSCNIVQKIVQEYMTTLSEKFETTCGSLNFSLQKDQF